MGVECNDKKIRGNFVCLIFIFLLYSMGGFFLSISTPSHLAGLPAILKPVADIFFAFSFICEGDIVFSRN